MGGVNKLCIYNNIYVFFCRKSKGLFLIPKNNKTVYLGGLKVNEKYDEQMKILTSHIKLVSYFRHNIYYKELVYVIGHESLENIKIIS